jgi:hypothetical protein
VGESEGSRCRCRCRCGLTKQPSTLGQGQDKIGSYGLCNQSCAAHPSGPTELNDIEDINSQDNSLTPKSVSVDDTPRLPTSDPSNAQQTPPT